MNEYMRLAVIEHAREHGAVVPDQEWISSPFDTWERNPHYVGPPGPHPNDCEYDA